jgi:hypothetical protein
MEFFDVNVLVPDLQPGGTGGNRARHDHAAQVHRTDLVAKGVANVVLRWAAADA